MTDANKFSTPYTDQKFDNYNQWLSKAPRWLTNHPSYSDGSKTAPFRALCYDSNGNHCRSGADFMQAKTMNAFPVWWIWPDQIPDLINISNHHP